MKSFRFGGVVLLACIVCACGDDEAAEDKITVFIDTTFDSDPTAQDSNGDGIMDWIVRDGSAYTDNVTIQSGGYSTFASFKPVLDTRPEADWPDHTEWTVVFRAVEPKDTDEMTDDLQGAVFFNNIDGTGNDEESGKPGYSKVVLCLSLMNNGTQTLMLRGDHGPYVKVPDLPNDWVTATVHVDLGAPTTVSLTVNGEKIGTYDRQKRNGTELVDKFASVLGWKESAEFKSALIQQRIPADASN